MFTVTLPGGEELTFKAVASLEELNAIKAGVTEFVKMMESGSMPPSWAEFATKDIDALAAVYAVSHMSVEPKLSQFDCLKLAAKAGTVLDYIRREVDAHQFRKDILDFEEKKSESEAITDSETDLP